MKSLNKIIEDCDSNEILINSSCVDIFVDNLQQGYLHDNHWVKRYITKDMQNIINLKQKMIDKLNKSIEKSRGGWWKFDCDNLYLRQLLHEHSMKHNENNEIDILNFVMFLNFKER